MDSTTQEHLIDIQSDDETRVVFHTHSWKILESLQWELSRALGISVATITAVSNDVFCWARFLSSSLLRIRNKYCNRFDMKKTRKHNAT